jgi:hypothetical protein
VLFRSVAHDKVPEKPDQFVRATLFIGGYAFLPVPDQESVAKVVRVIHLEPNGSIPASIVSMKSNELHAQMQLFQNLF